MMLFLFCDIGSGRLVSLRKDPRTAGHVAQVWLRAHLSRRVTAKCRSRCAEITGAAR